MFTYKTIAIALALVAATMSNAVPVSKAIEVFQSTEPLLQPGRRGMLFDGDS